MSPDPWNAKTLAGLAALAILIGLGTAYCQHLGDDPVTTDPCVGAAYAVPAAPAATKRSSSSRKHPAPPSAVRKAPRPSATAVVRPSASQSSSGHGHRPHVDIDVDLDGC
ncbi:hypothetical protein [Streptomyces sp. Root369]|uniref:hypothetical protein n=1 Tax=Streptomyces sp. Root369 TaxID=1736523 RepID=UPI000709A44B|nr:hypothetical protein [Streptomyces sp. Root369]KQW13584.1 hypothetical protein ASD08_30950 [Streptomyces sp. Root369]